MFILLIIAGIGLFSSIVTHILALCGNYPQENLPSVWLLHFGVFIVWIPTVKICQKLAKGTKNRLFIWQKSLKYSPGWLRRLCALLLVYAVINFVVFINNVDSIPFDSIHHETWIIRGFSGHWMLFYCFAFSVMLARRNLKMK